MRQAHDWRLRNQLQYLKGAQLFWRRYAPASPANDHDHCEFCMAEFMVNGQHNSQSQGYSTLDGFRWVCKPCFDDYVDMFDWKLANEA